jgi:hypothetical protein
MIVIAQGQAAAQVTYASGASTVAASTQIFNVISGEPGAGSQLNLSAPGSNRLNGQSFRVKASGYVTLTAGTFTSSVQPLLYASTSSGFTASAAAAIYSASAIAITVSSATAKQIPFSIEALLEGDSTSGLLNGSVTGLLNNGAQQGATAPVAIVNAPTSINFATEPPLQFAMSVAVGVTSNTYPLNGGTANLTQFQIES